MKRIRVLTIAGSDPSGGAGIQADLAVFAAFSRHGMAVVSGLTVQNSRGVTATRAMTAEFVAAQLDALLRDCPPAAVKTGMLPSADVARVVAAALAARPDMPLVVDPVSASADGVRFADRDDEREIRSLLLSRATLVTPNGIEASAMTGIDVTDVDGAVAAARRLVDLGARAALVKGGHVPGDRVVDVLVEAGRAPAVISRPRIATRRRVHGTGCALSAAVAALLADGTPLERAVRAAGDYVHAAIAGAYAIGAGAAVLDFSAAPAEFPR